MILFHHIVLAQGATCFPSLVKLWERGEHEVFSKVAKLPSFPQLNLFVPLFSLERPSLRRQGSQCAERLPLKRAC